ncbi:MAG: amino acid adenylation domain-containing protein, partial [Gammaproteobacteria bacterium]
MSAAELLRRLRSLGVNLRVEQGELKVSAPKGVLTKELQEQLRSNKTALTELLHIADSSAMSAQVEIPHADRTKSIPLSFAQQRMWFLEEFEGGSSVYNIPWAMRLKGELNKAALQLGLDALIARHESLRSVFLKTDADPEQKVLESMPLRIEEVELLDAGEETLQRKLEDWSQESFNLETGPLLRVRLITLGENDHVLMMAIHHIVSDAWSLDVLQTEFFASYFAAIEGRAAEFAELPLQFADYAVWQRDHLQGDELQRQLSYWTDKLRGAPPLLELPTDYPRPPEQSYRGSRRRRLLPVQLREELKKLAKQHNATLFMVLLAAFSVLLKRYSGEDDIVVGTPIAGRQQTELEGLIGLFLNTLALRTQLTSQQSFTELLVDVQTTALDAYAHQDLPFDKLVDALQPSRDMSHAPVFQVQFMLQNAPASGEPLEGLEISAVEFEYGTAKFDLTLATGETPDGLMAEIEFATDLFDAVTIERMLEHYDRLLQAIVSNPAVAVGELPLAGADDLDILRQWNNTDAAYPQDETLQTLIETQVDKTPDAIALIVNNQELSYRELNSRANQLAAWLQTNGVVPDAMVGVYMERSVEMVVALLGIIKAGGAYVPLDPDYPEQRIVHMLEDAEMALLLTQSHLADQLPEHALKLLELDTTEELAELSAVNPAVTAGPENLAYAIFTSGSTGRPKGVMNEHHGIVNRLLWMQSEYGLDATDRVLQKTPFSFDVSVWEFFWPLITGATLVVARPGGHKDSTYLIDSIRDHAVTTMHFVPSMLQVFLQDGNATTCDSLRRVICSGEALSHDLQTRFFAVFDKPGLHNLYGPTEAAIDVTYWACERNSAAKTVPIGRPVANTRIHVVEPSGALAPIGVAGELWIGGAQVARGYAGRPELTSERFVADPFSDQPGARIYRTGDLVRWRNDGVIEFLGRIDHQVKLRGFRIELGEIEATLDALPAVEQSLVMLREDNPGQKRLVAYVTGTDGVQPDVPAMRDALKDALPEYMVPAVFMSLEEFPLLPNGKVNRRELPEPEGKRDVTDEFVPAGSDHEVTLADIWSDLLGVERVGVNDNFFELGGDSILSIQIIARAAKAGLHLTPKQVFKHQTVAELASVVGTATVVDAEQGVVTGVVPFTPVQQWFLQQGETGLAHFNQSVVLEVNHALNVDQLEALLAELHQQHDALRLRLTQQDNEWVQHLDAPVELPALRQVDLSNVAEAERDAAIQDECDAAQAGIDINSGSLMAARYFFRGADQPALLMLVIHHLAIDGVGWRILFEDLETAGQQLLAGDAIKLPAKTSSFKAWSRRLQKYAASPALSDEVEYWQDLISDTSCLPVDTADGLNTVGSARSVQIELSEEQTSSLLKQVPRAYRTRINDVLLTGLARAIDRWCGQRSCLIELEGHGREELFDDLDVSRTLGWFTSIYPVQLTLATERNPGSDLKTIKEQLRNVAGNGLGYGLLRFNAQRTELQASAGAEILFNYLGQFDQALDSDGLFAVAPVSAGLDQSPERLRSHLLDINGSILGGQLRIGISYSQALHNKATIEELANLYQEELQKLIAHCLVPEHYGRTPSDYPLCDIDQAAVDRLVGSDENVADIYPVTPMQHGMLFHAIYEADRDSYLSQVIWQLEGTMDIAAFEKAWQLVIDRHVALRTSIVALPGGEPLQVAYKSVDVSVRFTDWREHDQQTCEQNLQAFLEKDRLNHFSFEQLPLLRLSLFRFDEQDYRFIWSFHHIIIDG